MERISGDARTTAGGGEADSRIHVRSNPADEAVTGKSAPGAGEARDRFGKVRERLADRAARTATAIDRRTGLVSTVRSNPLAAVGIAFSLGFVVAAATAVGDRHWMIERARRHLRTAIVGGIAATFADEIRDLLTGEESVGSLVHSMLSDEDGDDEDDDDFEV
jgi:hypothetical protein